MLPKIAPRAREAHLDNYRNLEWIGGQQPSIVPSSVGQQSPPVKPMALQAEFFEQEAATAWGALMVLFDDLQHPSMFPDGSGQHAPCSLRAAQAELSSQAPRRVVVTVATFRGSWQHDWD